MSKEKKYSIAVVEDDCVIISNLIFKSKSKKEIIKSIEKVLILAKKYKASNTKTSELIINQLIRTLS